jgi:glycosyltransferase involved in cell wall biosynthesis
MSTDSGVPHLALITPWPPQASGIADYAFDLAIGLSQHGAEVTVFTDEPSPMPPGHGVRVRHLSGFSGPEGYDHVIYQMGNHPRFQSAMIPLLAQHGGIVHLHDLVLQHLIAFYTCSQGNQRLYQQLLLHWYGQETLDEFLGWNNPTHKYFWESEQITRVPLFEPIVRFAQGCIVHSRFARERVQQRLPGLACRMIPQVYRDVGPVPTPVNARFRIGIFGSVHPNKHVDKALRAIARAVDQGADIELEIVGALEGTCNALPALADELGLAHRTTWHGRVEAATFHDLMQSVDLCLSLRYPTMGETSAVVSRALSMGIPMVVNNVDWYAELPSVVPKLAVDHVVMQRELDDLILRHALDAEYHRQARLAAATYARTSLDVAQMSAQYVKILDELMPARTRCIGGRLAST